ncbi:epidermal growth factor receptor substrate 15-like 1 isoform X1 [Kryptolebias marmoratus]|uniref:epidermal growth factor receptor substrate 15-like 1 isoform X1 n=1 Tax=Kryptolebias marmoratus TaxID=37003 RepID=UPI0007F8EDC4|nr:epidermal growth factor receptor substrate 15-like 1 isoform X1 [Kryptolebias marmoratus]
MAALMTLSQLSNGNAAFESYYRQLDPGNTGKISPGDAAQFLKKSGLSDSTLGKIWDLADSDRKGYLDKRGFFIALRLVATAQGGNDISLNNLSQTVTAPKFRDTDSPSLSVSAPASDSQWAIRPDEKGKFEGIFESLSPVKGLLSGDKVRPVLINSKLPLDVLGKIWDLSDLDKDGHLDKEEFTVAMHLVYRTMEKEPVPSSLPPSLIPPSKRKKSASALAGAVAVLPGFSGLKSSPAPLRETLRSTPALGSSTLLGSSTPPLGSVASSLGGTTPLSASAINLSPKHSFKSSSAPEVKWVVPVTDREKYKDLFKKTDVDNNGFITGTDIIEIFMQSNLSQSMLAQIWGLADTKQTGKLTQEQFALAMHLIQQKVNKGIDPPSTLAPDMIPPSERTSASALSANYLGLLSSVRPDLASTANVRRDSASSVGPVELTGIKELDDLSQEIAQLQREKFFLEQEIKQQEEAIRQKTTDLQDVQSDLDREQNSLQNLDSQKQDAQVRLDEMDQQRSKLEGMLNEVKQKCQEETQQISSLQSQIRSKETNLRSQEDELGRTKVDLSRLQDEEAQLEQRLLSGRVQLDSIVKSLKTTQDEINQARSKLSLIQDNQKELSKTIEQYNNALSEISKGNLSNLLDLSEGLPERENGGFRSAVRNLEDSSFKSRIAMFNNNSTKESPADPFQAEDPFKSDLLKDPFGEDPFKENDPFKGASSDDFFKMNDKSNMFGSSDPFSRKPPPPVKPSSFNSGDRFKPSSPKPKDSDLFGKPDPFGSSSFAGRGGGFADFSKMSKKSDNPAVPAKKNVPNRPAPPYVGMLSLGASEPLQGVCSSAVSSDSFVTTHSSKASKDCPVGFAEFGSFGSESQQLEWAKRESEREEQERLRRLQLQEQQDLELAIALSKADFSNS